MSDRLGPTRAIEVTRESDPEAKRLADSIFKLREGIAYAKEEELSGMTSYFEALDRDERALAQLLDR